MNRSFGEIHAGVAQTIAVYTHALDDGDTEAVAATYCEDGRCDIAGFGTFEGRDAIREAYAGWTPRRPQRHLVLNTRLATWSDDQADAVSDVVFLLQGKDGSWAVQLVGRYHDVLRREGEQWRFLRRTAEFVR